MKFEKSLKKSALKLVKNTFYIHTYFILFAELTMLLLKIIQITYKIKSFNYLYAVVLIFAGLAVYKLYSKILYSKYKKILFTAFIIILLSVVIYKFKAYAAEYLEQLIKYYLEINEGFYLSHETYFYQYAPFLTIAVPILTSGGLYLFARGHGNTLLLSGLLYLILLWYSSGLIEAKIYVLFYIISTFLAYGHIKFNNSLEEYKKQKIRLSVDSNRVLIYLLVLSTILGVFTYASVKAFGIKDIFTIAQERRERSKSLEKKSFNNRYDLSLSGYPDSSKKLGGPIELNYDTVFKIQSDKTYYLRGRVKDFYDGYRWVKAEDKYEKLSIIPRPYQGKSFREAQIKTLSIYPEALNTSTLFSPSFTFDLNLNKGQAAMNKEGSFMIVGEPEAESPYTASFYEILPNAEFFTEAYKNNLFTDYQAGDKEFVRKYGDYLQLPSNISEQTYKLVGEITKDAKTSFEKIKAIQIYLTDNYKYSLEASEVPEKREFVDYFLFEEKKGYCTYFATASAIMCRIAGIPSRYVEGFRMGDKRDSYGKYDVMGSMAHAWSEVLINDEEDIWSIVETVPEAARVQVIETMEGKNNTTVSNNAENKSAVSKRNKNGFSIINLSKLLIWGILLAFCSILSLIIYKIINGIKHRKDILNSESVVPLYYYIKNRVKSLNRRCELPEDDYLWIEKLEANELKPVVTVLIEAAYEEFYGKKLRNDFDKVNTYNLVEAHIKNSQNKFKYYLLLLLGI